MNWSELWNSMISMHPGVWEICTRLACAMLVGLVIGTEREYTHRPAGMRTHILVALGACAVSITGELLFHQYSAIGSTADPARLSAQVITGVGFLGAGTIMREGFSVKGLTTAASVWAVACLGIAAGFGYYILAISGMVFIFVTLTFFEWLQSKLIKRNGDSEEYVLDTADVAATVQLINEQVKIEQGGIKNLSVEALTDGYRVTFRAEFGGRHKKQHQQRFIGALAMAPETLALRHGGETVQTEAV